MNNWERTHLGKSPDTDIFDTLEAFYTWKIKYSCLFILIYGNKSLLNQNYSKLKFSVVKYDLFVTHCLQSHYNNYLICSSQKLLEIYSGIILPLTNEETEDERVE